MEKTLKTNRLAVVSMVCGGITLLSLGLFYTLLAINQGNPTGPYGPTLISIMDLTVPLRNMFSTAAVVTGILALVEIKKKEGAQKGSLLAWAGILLGAVWFVTRLVVGLVFLLSKFQL